MLPPAIRSMLETRLNTTVQDVVPLAGGMINRVAKVECADGPILVKWNQDSPPGMFAAEAAGLHALAATNTLRIPRVLLYEEQETPSLVLEFLPSNPIVEPLNFVRRFAQQLATLHQRSAADHPACGWEQDNFLGVFPQQNTPRTTSWADFYRDCRLLPQIDRAYRAGHLPPARTQQLHEVIENLDVLLDTLPPEYSLLHGDLWAGNFLCLPGDVPALIDPAVYIGPREMELAYIELFGGFPPGFVEAYRDAWPLSSDYERRRPLHQLYPLLVHLNCFGEKYGPWVERTCQTLLK